MRKIQELSESLANQIAAGEVVERPASVVKELIENAIDAGSTQIDIVIEEAGLRKIQVTDNGEGIASEDVQNAFKRHATSKIHSRDDLFRIRTLGFRGEALPSIASVSKLELETSTGDGMGNFICLEGGKIISEKPSALRKGTKITVTDLFYNTPARLKYVKSIQTELANIGDIVNRLAMSNPSIAFRLVHEGNKMIITTGNGDLKQTIAGIYGVSTAKKTLKINKEDLDFQVHGYVSLPELTRASRNYTSIIINGRYIKNYILTKAIVAGYGSKLMVGRFPIAVVSITMDPLLVDVNVHPTKQEVRLSKEKELQELISSAIQEALANEQLIPNAADNLNFKRKQMDKFDSQQITLPLSSKEKPQFNEARHSLAYDARTGQFYVPEAETTYEESEKNEKNKTNNIANAFSSRTVFDGKDQVAEVENAYSILSDQTENFAESADFPSSLALEKTEMNAARVFPELEYFGQMHGTYLFAQSEEGLYIIDQHAAQERIKYEYYRKKIGEVNNDLQELLVPIVLDYPNSDVIKIREQQSILENVGIFLEDFGQNSFIIRSHPTWYPQGEEEVVIRAMIDTMLTTGKVNVAKFREQLAIMMSCKKSIKANHYLNVLQAQQLLSDLAQCENPYNCPHGRPVLIRFTNKDMEKMFKRIQDPH